MLVLRKGFGAYSAGTCVELVTQPGKTRSEVTVKVLTGRIKQTHNLKNYVMNELIDVPVDYITELRPRTRVY